MTPVSLVVDVVLAKAITSVSAISRASPETELSCGSKSKSDKALYSKVGAALAVQYNDE